MIKSRLCEFFGIEHPVILAPMAIAGGGALAAAVSGAGGLGLIGGGYGNADWIEREFTVAGDAAVGCGLITWKLAENPDILDMVLAKRPVAMFLSFGDPKPFVRSIKAAGVPLICQVQTLRDAANAIDCGADVIVAQGAEAGGHGEARGTLSLVAETADYLAQNAPGVLLCAAGGIADGRGLVAALSLGADGVVMGSRFWASHEALVPKAMHSAAIGAIGDKTIRTDVMDVARGLDWPSRYTARVLQNQFTDTWHGHSDTITKEVGDQWQADFIAGDPLGSNTFVGEAAGLISSIEPAAGILRDVMLGAEKVIADLGVKLNVS